MKYSVAAISLANKKKLNGDAKNQSEWLHSAAASVVALLFFLAFSLSSWAALIQSSIVINGNMADWSAVLANTQDQVATDALGVAGGTDPDRTVQSTGRDLKTFSFTWNANNLYFYIERYASLSNQTWWWFYIDTDNDGFLQTNEYVFSVEWQGANRKTNAVLYRYIAANAGGDSLVCPTLADCPLGSVGEADGYDMPGSLGTGTTLYSKLTAGATSGLELEAYLPWANLGFSGPTSLGFHISSSNSTNLPAQIDDNMNGIGGGSSLAFLNMEVLKAASESIVAGGKEFTYTITVENQDTTYTAQNVIVDDVLPGQVTLVSAVASQGAYAGDSWSLGDLTAGTTATLTLTVLAGNVLAPVTFDNTASLFGSDVDGTDNESTVTVTVHPGPVLSVTKSSAIINDGVADSPEEVFHIPGSSVEYTIVLENSSTYGGADDVVISDPIPDNTTYIGTSVTCDVNNNGVPGSCTAAYDSVDNEVTVDVPEVTINSTTTVTFQVIID